MGVRVTDSRIPPSTALADPNTRLITKLGAITPAKPYQMQLIGLNSGRSIVFPYNAESYRETLSPTWADRNLPGRTEPIHDWVRNESGGLDVRYLLQLDDPEETASFVTALKGAATSIVETTGAPELWQFIAGAYDFVGHISGLSTDFIRTVESGDPEVVEIQFNMVSNAKGFG